MGIINSIKQQSVQTPLRQTVHYSQIASLPFNPSILYQRPFSKFHTRFLTKYTLPYLQSNQELTNYLIKLQKYGPLLDAQNLFFPVRCEVHSKGKTCSQQKVVNLYYEIYDFSLKMQMRARQRLQETFGEEEIWFIILSILNGLRQFEQLKIPGGNLKTEYVRMNEEGHIKILNLLTTSSPQQNHLIPTFYDEVMLQKLRLKTEYYYKSSKMHANLAETFALGVIILQISTFIDGNLFYDMVSLRFNQNTFEKALAILKQRYSPLLFNLVQVMLSKHEDRPLPSQIFDVFIQFKKQIMNLERFNFDSKKLRESLRESTFMSN